MDPKNIIFTNNLSASGYGPKDNQPAEANYRQPFTDGEAANHRSMALTHKGMNSGAP